MHMTQLEWPLAVFLGSCVLRSQKRTVVSPDPVHSSFPSGEKATERTLSEWPGIEEEHRVTGRTWKSACGWYTTVMVDSTETCLAWRPARLRHACAKLQGLHIIHSRMRSAQRERANNTQFFAVGRGSTDIARAQEAWTSFRGAGTGLACTVLWQFTLKSERCLASSAAICSPSMKNANFIGSSLFRIWLSRFSICDIVISNGTSTGGSSGSPVLQNAKKAHVLS